MKTLELLRKYNTTLSSHYDFHNVTYLTAISLNMLHFTFSTKDEADIIDYFQNELSKLDPTRDYSGLNGFINPRKFHDKKRFPVWGRRLLESFRLLSMYISNIPFKSERNRFCKDYLLDIEYCLQITFSLLKKQPVVAGDIICNTGKYLRLYRDYSILPVEILSSAYLKNLIFQINYRVEAIDSIELFPGASIDVCHIESSQLPGEFHLDEKGLALLMDKANTFLDKADSLTSIARRSTSLTEFLLVIKSSHFFYQVGKLMLQHFVSESEGQGLVVPPDIYREIKIAEENRAEIVQIFDTDCGALLIGPVCTPCGAVGQILYQQEMGEPLNNAGDVDVRQCIREGVLRNPVYPTILNNEWPYVLDSLDMKKPINFSGTNRTVFRNLSELLILGISKQFIKVFTDPSVAKIVIWQQHKWETAPLDVIDMILHHEVQHLRQFQSLKE